MRLELSGIALVFEPSSPRFGTLSYVRQTLIFCGLVVIALAFTLECPRFETLC